MISDFEPVYCQSLETERIEEIYVAVTSQINVSCVGH